MSYEFDCKCGFRVIMLIDPPVGVPKETRCVECQFLENITDKEIRNEVEQFFNRPVRKLQRKRQKRNIEEQ